jgi:hypothetical protein
LTRLSGQDPEDRAAQGQKVWVSAELMARQPVVLPVVHPVDPRVDLLVELPPDQQAAELETGEALAGPLPSPCFRILQGGPQ